MPLPAGSVITQPRSSPSSPFGAKNGSVPFRPGGPSGPKPNPTPPSSPSRQTTPWHSNNGGANRSKVGSPGDGGQRGSGGFGQRKGGTPFRAPASPATPKPNPGSPLHGTNWSLGQPKSPFRPGIPGGPAPAPGKIPGGAAGAIAGAAAGGLAAGEALRKALEDQGFNDFAYPSNTEDLLKDPANTIKDWWRGPDRPWSTPPSPPLSYPDRPAPFNGGQVPGRLYHVHVLVDEYSVSEDWRTGAVTTELSAHGGQSYSLPGPIGAVAIVSTGRSTDYYGRSFPVTRLEFSYGQPAQIRVVGELNNLFGVPSARLVGQTVTPLDGGADPGGDPHPLPERRQSPPPPYRLPDSPPRRDPYRDPAPDPAPPAPRKNPQSPNTPAGDPGKPSPVPTDKPKPGGPPPNRQPEVPEPYKKPAPSPRPSPTGPGTSPAGDPGPAPTPSPGPTNRPAPTPAPNKGPQVGGGAGAPQPTPAPTATRGGNSVDNASDPDGRWAEAFGGAAALAPLIPFDWSSKPSSTSDIGWGAPVALTPAQKEEFDRTGKLPDPQNQRPAVPDRPNTEAPASRAPGQKPAPTPAPAQAPAPTRAPSPDPAPAPGGDICQSPCIQAMGAGIDGAKKGVDDANLLLKKIAAVVGAEPAAFPATLPLLNGAAGTPVKNLPELILAVIKNLDAVAGQYPMEITTYTSDGSEKTATVYNQAHALSELFGLAIVIAEDADAVKNIAVRNIAETIKATISAKQAAEIAKANAKYLGYTGASKQRILKLTVTPSAVGPNNKLEQQELGDFLKPSTRNYIGWEFEGDNLQGVLFRILEGVEIARAALFHPIKSGKAAARLTGDWIKGDNKKRAKQKDERWVEIKGRLKKRGAKITETKGIKKDADPKPTDP